MVSNRSFNRLNLTHKRTLAFRCYCFCFLRNCTLTFKHRLNVLPIIADCILYFESDENRSSHREELNLLFRLNFYTMQFSMFAFHLTWNSFILPNSNSFVNNFFQVFQLLFSRLAPSFPTAFIYYQRGSHLSTLIFHLFSRFPALFCDLSYSAFGNSCPHAESS